MSIKLVLCVLLAIGLHAQIISRNSGNVVSGGGSLTTAGAIPYVVSAGTLGQAPTNLFYDVTNVKVSIGTETGSTGSGNRLTLTNTTNPYALAFKATGSGTAFYVGMDSASVGLNFSNNAGTGLMRLVGGSGNLLLATITDLGYNLHAASFATNGNLYVYTPTSVTGVTKAVVRAGAGQGGSGLLDITDSTSTVEQRFAPGSAYYQYQSGNIVSNFGAGTLTLASAKLFGFSSAANLNGGNLVDVAVGRNGVGVLEINNGTAGTYRDLKLRYLNSSANSTGAGSALLGANSPASTLTAPYTWVEMRANDGSTVYFPVWK